MSGTVTSKMASQGDYVQEGQPLLKLADLSTVWLMLELFPPLIVEYDSGAFLVRDGNHRHGAFSLLGLTSCWCILWYANRESYEHHEARGFELRTA